MSEEWGPWIEHDGKGCPCLGLYVESVERGGLVERHIAGGAGLPGAYQWHWERCRIADWQIVRYRIRKPRGLTMLEEIAKGVREPVDA